MTPRTTARNHAVLRRLALGAAAAAVGATVVAAPAQAGVASGAGDSFGRPVTITGFGGITTTSNTSATAQPGEPSHSVDVNGAPDLPDHSVWFSWTAPTTGRATFRTRGSDFDTVMAAYVGSSLPDLTQVASNDDTDMPLTDGSISEHQSQISFAAIKGTTYRIAVDSYTGSAGPINVPTGLIWLSWDANDDFAAAQPLTGTSGGTYADVTGATAQLGEPLHAGHVGGHSLWYRWTAPTDGTVTFDTAPSAVDTLLAAYTGKKVTQLKEIAANDDAPGLHTSEITFAAKAGTTYRIAVDGFGGAQGAMELGFAYDS